MEAPTIIKMEQEIEREMRMDAGQVESDYSDYEEPEPEPQLEFQHTTVAGWLESLKLEAFLPALEGLGYDDVDLLKEGDEEEMADVRTLMIECCVHT